MSTAAFSLPGNSPRRISMRQRGQTPASATSAAADDAIRQLVEARRRRNQNGDDKPPKPSLVSDALGAVTAPLQGSIQRLGIGRFAQNMTVKRYRRVGAQNRRLGQRACRLPQARGFQFEGADALHIGLGRLARDGLLQRLRVLAKRQA